MTLYDILPWIAVVAFVAAAAIVALGQPPGRRGWLVPAFLSAVFLAWSAFAVATGSAFGFWTEHTRNAWGNQIWFDLLIAVGVAWVLLVPKGRAAGMTPWPWLGLILISGGIGLLAMLSRYLYLRDRSPAAPPREGPVAP